MQSGTSLFLSQEALPCQPVQGGFRVSHFWLPTVKFIPDENSVHEEKRRFCLFLQHPLSQAVARGVVKAIKSGCKTIAFTV